MSGRGQWLWVPERIPSRNELDDMRGTTRTYFSQKSGRRVRANKYHDFKHRFHGRVSMYVKAQKLGAVESVPVAMTYVFFEPDRRRDPSNFCGSGQKLIEDALQECGILPGDGWKHILDFRHHWDLVETKASVGLAVFLSDSVIDSRKSAVLRAGDACSRLAA